MSHRCWQRGDLLNVERRTIVTPEDVDRITNETILNSKELFAFWWPTDQLGAPEERFIETLFRTFPAGKRVTRQEYFSRIAMRDEPTFRKALNNLRACEVLDSTQNEELRFSGTVLRRWLELQMQDGRLVIPRGADEPAQVRGQAGLFVDHENLLRTLDRIAVQRGRTSPSADPSRFAHVLEKLYAEAESRVGKIEQPVAVAFWSRPEEAPFSTPYARHDFRFPHPEQVKDLKNAVDFKLADEVRRARERAMKEGSNLTRAIVITGDGDYSHCARALINDGVRFQVWGGSKSTSEDLIRIIGEDNFVVLDDVCGNW